MAAESVNDFFNGTARSGLSNPPGGRQMVSDDGLKVAMREAIDPGGMMQRVADQTLTLVRGATGAMIGLADAHGVSYVWGAGSTARHVGTRVNMDASLSGTAIRTGQLTWSDDSANDARLDSAARERLSIGSAVCVPLSRGHEVLGVLTVVAASAHAFDQPDIDTLGKLAGYVGSAIALARDLARVNSELLELSNRERITKAS